MFDIWFESSSYVKGRVTVLSEVEDGRNSIHDDLVEIVADHLVDLEVIEEMGGFEECHEFLANRLPTSKTARSGDMGEILATEYIETETDYSVPVKRLRYKDDRNNAMRGDDVIGINVDGKNVTVLKTEAKSRVSLSDSVMRKARKGLSKNKGRPNPGTLAFIQYLLAKERKFGLAKLFKALQDEGTIGEDRIQHLLFTLSGNDPTNYLKKKENVRKIRGITLQVVGLRVSEHACFIKQIFDDCLALGKDDGNS